MSFLRASAADSSSWALFVYLGPIHSFAEFIQSFIEAACHLSSQRSMKERALGSGWMAMVVVP